MSQGRSAVLNEQEILGELVSKELVVTPLIDLREQLGPTSLDIRLGFQIGVFNITKFSHIDPLLDVPRITEQLDEYVSKIHIAPMEPFVLHPGEFVLASTLEYFSLPRHLAGRLEGRSTWGRLGLQVHATAGFVDPGFQGILTFELQNVGKGALKLFPGLRIAQICFYRTLPTLVPYTSKPGAKYFGALEAVGSLFYRDSEFDVIRRHVLPAGQKGTK